MFVDPDLYRKAFQEYLRKGTPIEWSVKQARPTTHYIWRTRGDEKVRPSHAANDGKVFAWDSPPPTGHPGEDYGCRCTAEPYQPDMNEHLEITLGDVFDTGTAWASRDFVRHYYRGRGRGVTVRETGHLTSVVARYMQLAEERIKRQIVAKARAANDGPFSYDFKNSYDLETVVFSIGDTTIGGDLSGQVTNRDGVLSISGELVFYLRDEFADPLDIGIEAIDLAETFYENVHRPIEDYLRGQVGLPRTGMQRPGVHVGEPYPITDDWTATLRGQVYSNPSISRFK